MFHKYIKEWYYWTSGKFYEWKLWKIVGMLLLAVIFCIVIINFLYQGFLKSAAISTCGCFFAITITSILISTIKKIIWKKKNKKKNRPHKIIVTKKDFK
jgi:hypothetical protein